MVQGSDLGFRLGEFGVAGDVVCDVRRGGVLVVAGQVMQGVEVDDVVVVVTRFVAGLADAVVRDGPPGD